MSEKQLQLDDDEDEKIGIDSELLYSLCKWGKALMILSAMRLLYLISKSLYWLIGLEGTLLDEPKYRSGHALVLVISLAYVPVMVSLFKFYFGLKKALDAESSTGLNKVFIHLKTGVTWNVIVLMFDFSLNVFYEQFLVQLI